METYVIVLFIVIGLLVLTGATVGLYFVFRKRKPQPPLPLLDNAFTISSDVSSAEGELTVDTNPNVYPIGTVVQRGPPLSSPAPCKMRTWKFVKGYYNGVATIPNAIVSNQNEFTYTPPGSEIDIFPGKHRFTDTSLPAPNFVVSRVKDNAVVRQGYATEQGIESQNLSYNQTTKAICSNDPELTGYCLYNNHGVFSQATTTLAKYKEGDKGFQWTVTPVKC